MDFSLFIKHFHSKLISKVIFFLVLKEAVFFYRQLISFLTKEKFYFLENQPFFSFNNLIPFCSRCYNDFKYFNIESI